ncbi:DoxX family protein [Novosphingobium sp.]|uniref:DoxX family protein n=1 Tax=Novosphingobium sp. TaxID=1874826 RepID=UPI003B51CA95
MLARRLTRYFLVAAYFAAGVLHLAKPAPFLTITPAWVPDAPLVIALTGLAELAGAIGLAQPVSPRLRVAAGWGLAAYALCVWPANVHHMMMDLARPDRGLGWAYHGPRMIAQPVLIWAALWCSGALDRFKRAR